MKANSRLVVLLAVAVAILAGGWFFLQPPPQAEQGEVKKPGRVLPPSVKPVPPDLTILPMAEEVAAALAAKDGTVEDDLATIELLLSSYGRNHGGNPTGENEEITAALLGKNDKRVAYLKRGGSYLDQAGRLIDRWGNPYAFHSLTSTWTEIRSAGQDGKLFTKDDGVRGKDGLVK